MSRQGWMGSAALAAAAAASAALGQPAGSGEVILSDVGFPELATTTVPQLAGRLIETIDRPTVSPDGRRWAISLNIDGPTTTDDVIVVWDGAAFLTLVQEGVTLTPQFDFVGAIDENLAINDSGEVAFITNTDGPTDFDDLAAKVSPTGVVTVVAREKDPVPGRGVLYGSDIDSVQIDNAGNVYFSADTTDLLGFDEYIVRTADGVSATVLFQEGVTIPAGQAGGAALTWDNFDLNDFAVTGDAQHTLLQGDTEGGVDSDQILAYDNSVVVQEGVAVDPSFVSIADLGTPVIVPVLAPNGDWYAIGDNEDGQAWILRNGEPIARQSDALFPSAPLLWGAFSSIAADGRGNYVVSGSMRDADAARDGVLVLNGERIVAREDDPIDLDGNGLFDDGVRIAAFGAHDAIITADGRLITQVTTRGRVGELLVAFDLEIDGAACPCEMNGDAGVDVFDLLAYLDRWFAGAAAAEVDGSPGVDVFDLLAFLDCWFGASGGSHC